MNRIIREKLIESGISFEFKKGLFKTKNFLIGFSASPLTIKEKLILVFENKKAIQNYLKSLSHIQRAKVYLKTYNSSLQLVTIGQLDDIL